MAPLWIVVVAVLLLAGGPCAYGAAFGIALYATVRWLLG